MPVMFRCFQCNQVLRTSLAKVGAVVACPKCGVQLLVPEPAGKAPGTGETGSGNDPTEVIRAAVTPTPAPDFPDIRPEDIRAEPGVLPRVAARRPPSRTEVEPSSASAVPVVDTKRDPAPRVAPSFPSPDADPDFPPIRIDPVPIKPTSPPSLSSNWTGQPRARDIVVPRAALVGWSLFGLLALVMAFLAGLLAGRFLWVVRIIKTQ